MTTALQHLRLQTLGERRAPLMRKSIPSIFPGDLWMVEIGDRAAGWLASENRPSEGVRLASILHRALPRHEWKERHKEHHQFVRSCLSKKRYPTGSAAFAEVQDAQRSRGVALWYYSCRYCGGVHLTRNLRNRPPELEQS